MIKLNGIETRVDAYQTDVKDGVDIGLELQMVYNGISCIQVIPYAEAVYLARQLDKDDPLKKEMEQAFKDLPKLD